MLPKSRSLRDDRKDVGERKVDSDEDEHDASDAASPFLDDGKLVERLAHPLRAQADQDGEGEDRQPGADAVKRGQRHARSGAGVATVAAEVAGLRRADDHEPWGSLAFMAFANPSAAALEALSCNSTI